MDPALILRVVAAVVLGGLVGLERELHDKPAGFRTIILICVGACVFTIVSEVVGSQDWDRTRIAAQIVTGIGFLGAGAILRDRKSVIGLTTAATIWAVAAIGMAVGFGEYGLALTGTAALLVVLFLFDMVENWIGDSRDIQDHRFQAVKAPDALDRVVAMFEQAGLQARHRTFHEDGDVLVFQIRAMGAKKNHEKLRLDLARSDDYTLLQA